MNWWRLMGWLLIVLGVIALPSAILEPGFLVIGRVVAEFTIGLWLLVSEPKRNLA